ncbi:sigma-70 family RNA polymerase sigma factor [soil metagenome]
MTQAITINAEMTEQNQRLEDAVRDNRNRLFAFIRQRVDNSTDAEDVLQDVFEELTEAYRLTTPIEQVAAWLIRVAKNKIIDRYRKKKTLALEDQKFAGGDGDDEPLLIADLLRGNTSSPDSTFDNNLLWNMIEEGLDELPADQRKVFVWHELDGKSFTEIAEETGVSVNTLLSRKRYAVLHLREKLREVYEEMFG